MYSKGGLVRVPMTPAPGSLDRLSTFPRHSVCNDVLVCVAMILCVVLILCCAGSCLLTSQVGTGGLVCV